METINVIQKDKSRQAAKKGSVNQPFGSNPEVNDLNTIIDEVANNKKEKEAKEERERRIRESVQKEYVRIGDKYFKLVYKPDKNGRTQRLYVERLKTTITDDFGKNSIRWVKKYEGFCQVPSHVNYKSEINGFFNEYYQLTHKPQPGDFGTIRMMLNHIFGEFIDFAMDYMHFLYVHPTQRLPIILLESKEKNTGKSTFGSLLKMIFQENAVKIGNSDFESDFNALWIKSLCIIVDETSLDKKGVMQTIKRLSTETTKVTSNEKNRAQHQVDFIGKFVFMSNDEGKALPIERGDPRFAVFKVPTFKERGIKEDPNIEEKIVAEIPAFLHYLASMTPTYQEQGRMYFSPDVYRTRQLLAYYEGSQSYTAKAIQEFIRDAFEMFPEQAVLHFAVTDLIEQLTACKYLGKCDRQQVKKAIEEDLSISPATKQRYDYFNLSDAHNASEMFYSSKRNNWVYEFHRERFKIV